MIARRGPVIVDHGPCPGRVNGLDAVSSIVLRSEPFVSPVERRYLSPEELATIRRADPVEPLPEPILALPSRTKIDLAAARVRGGEATRRAYRPKQPMGRPRIFTDEALLAAILANHGSQLRAAEALGVSRSGVKRRLATMRKAGPLPADVAAVLRGPGGWWRWEAA